MLRGWLREKKGELNASTHSLNALAEPQDSTSIASALRIQYANHCRQSRRQCEVILSTMEIDLLGDGLTV